jgi:hypothetical protein
MSVFAAFVHHLALDCDQCHFSHCTDRAQATPVQTVRGSDDPRQPVSRMCVVLPVPLDKLLQLPLSVLQPQSVVETRVEQQYRRASSRTRSECPIEQPCDAPCTTSDAQHS